MVPPTIDEIVFISLGEVYNRLKESKPNDKSEKDRHYAIAITEMEKVMGFFYLWVLQNNALQAAKQD